MYRPNNRHNHEESRNKIGQYQNQSQNYNHYHHASQNPRRIENNNGTDLLLTGSDSSSSYSSRYHYRIHNGSNRSRSVTKDSDSSLSSIGCQDNNNNNRDHFQNQRLHKISSNSSSGNENHYEDNSENKYIHCDTKLSSTTTLPKLLVGIDAAADKNINVNDDSADNVQTTTTRRRSHRPRGCRGGRKNRKNKVAAAAAAAASSVANIVINDAFDSDLEHSDNNITNDKISNDNDHKIARVNTMNRYQQSYESNVESSGIKGNNMIRNITDYNDFNIPRMNNHNITNNDEHSSTIKIKNIDNVKIDHSVQKYLTNNNNNHQKILSSPLKKFSICSNRNDGYETKWLGNQNEHQRNKTPSYLPPYSKNDGNRDENYITHKSIDFTNDQGYDRQDAESTDDNIIFSSNFVSTPITSNVQNHIQSQQLDRPHQSHYNNQQKPISAANAMMQYHHQLCNGIVNNTYQQRPNNNSSSPPQKISTSQRNYPHSFLPHHHNPVQSSVLPPFFLKTNNSNSSKSSTFPQQQHAHTTYADMSSLVNSNNTIMKPMDNPNKLSVQPKQKEKPYESHYVNQSYTDPFNVNTNIDCNKATSTKYNINTNVVNGHSKVNAERQQHKNRMSILPTNFIHHDDDVRVTTTGHSRQQLFEESNDSLLSSAFEEKEAFLTEENPSSNFMNQSNNISFNLYLQKDNNNNDKNESYCNQEIVTNYIEDILSNTISVDTNPITTSNCHVISNNSVNNSVLSDSSSSYNSNRSSISSSSSNSINNDDEDCDNNITLLHLNFDHTQHHQQQRESSSSLTFSNVIGKNDYRTERIEKQRQMLAKGGSLFVTSPRSFLFGGFSNK